MRTGRSGRIRAIDDLRLAELARADSLTVVVLTASREFVAEGEVVAHLHGPASADHARRTRDAIEVGTRRTLTQDVAFGIDQLTGIARRALPEPSDVARIEEAAAGLA